jgi:hypothetical protein
VVLVPQLDAALAQRFQLLQQTLQILEADANRTLAELAAEMTQVQAAIDDLINNIIPALQAALAVCQAQPGLPPPNCSSEQQAVTDAYALLACLQGYLAALGNASAALAAALASEQAAVPPLLLQHQQIVIRLAGLMTQGTQLAAQIIAMSQSALGQSQQISNLFAQAEQLIQQGMAACP